MYETLKRLYLSGKMDEAQLNKALEKGWITEEEKEKIIASKKND